MNDVTGAPDITGCCKLVFVFDGAVADVGELEKKGEAAFSSLGIPEIEFVATRLTRNFETKQYRFSVYLRSEIQRQRLLNLLLDAFLELVPTPGAWNLVFLSKEEQAGNIQRIRSAILDAENKFA